MRLKAPALIILGFAIFSAAYEDETLVSVLRHEGDFLKFTGSPAIVTVNFDTRCVLPVIKSCNISYLLIMHS